MSKWAGRLGLFAMAVASWGACSEDPIETTTTVETEPAAPCVVTDNVYAIEGCPISECLMQQVGCDVSIVCSGGNDPISFTGTIDGSEMTFATEAFGCTGTIDEDGTIIGLCDICEFVATPGAPQHTGWGCDLSAHTYGCVCDFEGTGNGTVKPNAVPCPIDYTCCRTFLRKGVPRCACYHEESQCGHVDTNPGGATEVEKCPPNP